MRSVKIHGMDAARKATLKFTSITKTGEYLSVRTAGVNLQKKTSNGNHQEFFILVKR